MARMTGSRFIRVIERTLIVGALLASALVWASERATAQPAPDEPSTVAGVPLLLPAYIPAGYEPFNSSRRGHVMMPDIDVMALIYRDAAGHELHVVQGWPVPYEDEAYQRAPAEDTGIATVMGQPALWLRGLVFGEGSPLTLPRDGLALRWQTGALTPEGEPVGYTVEGDGLPLDELLAVAESLRIPPVPPGVGPATGIAIPTSPVRAQPAPAPQRTINLGHIDVRSDPGLQAPPLMIGPGKPLPPTVIMSRPVSLEEARALVDFAVLLPGRLPSESFALARVDILEIPGGAQVTLVYRDETVDPRVTGAREIVIHQRRWAGISQFTVPFALEEGMIAGRPAAFWDFVLPGLALPAGGLTRHFALFELGDLLITINTANVTRAEIADVAESLGDAP